MNEKLEALEAEVKFLRELVTKLMVERAGPVIIREVERNPYHNPANPQPYTPSPYPNPYPPFGPTWEGVYRITC